MRQLRVNFANGAVFDIPLKLVIQSCAEYFQDHGIKPSDEQLIEWAVSEMNWSDVSEHAKMVRATNPPDYQSEWVECLKVIVE
jgi:hypothetical protein